MKLLLLLAIFGAHSAVGQLPGRVTSHAIRVGLTERTFELFVPSSWTRDSPPIPIIIEMHGYTSNPAQQRRFSNSDQFADRADFQWAVVYPRGTGISPSWNGGACCGSSITFPYTDDIRFLRQMIDEIDQNLNVSIRRDAIFAMGFSNGAFMSQRLSCEAPDLVRAVGSDAGRRAFGADFRTCNQTNVPVIAMSGTADTLVPYTGSTVLGFPSHATDRTNARNRNGCNTISTRRQLSLLTTCDRFSQCSGGGFVEYCTVTNAIHSWFSQATELFFTDFREILNMKLNKENA